MLHLGGASLRVPGMICIRHWVFALFRESKFFLRLSVLLRGCKFCHNPPLAEFASRLDSNMNIATRERFGDSQLWSEVGDLRSVRKRAVQGGRLGTDQSAAPFLPDEQRHLGGGLRAPCGGASRGQLGYRLLFYEVGDLR